MNKSWARCPKSNRLAGRRAPQPEGPIYLKPVSSNGHSAASALCVTIVIDTAAQANSGDEESAAAAAGLPASRVFRR